jgi:hypothetical protein
MVVLLLFTLALIALTVLALLLAGVVAAIVTGIALLNMLAMLIGLRTRRRHTETAERERWKPSSFRDPPEPPYEKVDEDTPSLTIHRR